MREHDGGEAAPATWATWAAIAFAVVTLVLGVWSFAVLGPGEHEEPCARLHGGWDTDWLYRTFVLFDAAEINLQISECYAFWQAELARYTGAATVFAAAIGIFLAVVRAPLRRVRLFWMYGHTLVIGFGPLGRGHALRLRGAGRRVVVLARPGEEAEIARCGALPWVGNPHHFPTLQRLRPRHLTHCVVATDDDAANLAIAQGVARAAAACGRRFPIDAMVRDPVIRRAFDNRQIDPGIDLFSVPETLARRFCDDVRLHEIADLLGHARVHVVMAGRGDIVTAIAAQLARTVVVREGAPPLITLVWAGATAMAAEIAAAYPNIKRAAELKPVDCDLRSLLRIDDSDLRSIVQDAPVTALVVVGEDGEGALGPALALSAMVQRTDVWRAPGFVVVEDGDAMAQVGAPLNTTPRLSRVLQGVVLAEALVAPDRSDRREALARRFHAFYRAQREAEARKSEEAMRQFDKEKPLWPWESLLRTYRQANRRAADHVPAKLLAAGCVVPPGALDAPAGFRLLNDADTTGRKDRIARAEHASWDVDRSLDGWQPGEPRDNRRLIHPNMIPFDALPPQIQDYDREQVKVLSEFLANDPAPDAPEPSHDPLLPLRMVAASVVDAFATGRPPPVSEPPRLRFDRWIGVVATPGCKPKVLEALAGALEVEPDVSVTLIGVMQADQRPLLAAMLDALASAGRQHRLLLLEASDVDDKPWTELLQPATRPALALPARILELGDAGDGPRRQAAWLARRCDLLLLAPDGTGKDVAAQAAAFVANPGTIPATPAYAPRACQPPGHSPLIRQLLPDGAD